ncbi:MAG: twin-arginine translocase TatA/TatE family subunit [Kofleriaceae bacterium]|nr:twin-arginine translocase TatA/TatE family subunit [Kofleriaceae bacterium]MCL4223050.1 twin-arginine translocase TatA/TatE family subunit [Myxococcales bacterium]
MFGMGMTEILVILVVAMIFLGPDKLPEAAAKISKGIRDIRRQQRELQQTIESDNEIGGAIRDLKSALRGDDLLRPPVRKPPPPAVPDAAAAAALAGTSDPPGEPAAGEADAITAGTASAADTSAADTSAADASAPADASADASAPAPDASAPAAADDDDPRRLIRPVAGTARREHG